MLGALAGLLRGASNGQDPLLLVDGLPESLSHLTALQLLEDLWENRSQRGQDLIHPDCSTSALNLKMSERE